CAGGSIIPSISEPGLFCTNGMSNSRHDTPYANSGLVVTLDARELVGDHPLAGVEVQRRFERAAFELAGQNYYSPIQRASDFVGAAARRGVVRFNGCSRREPSPLPPDQFCRPAVRPPFGWGCLALARKGGGDFWSTGFLVGL